VGGADPGCNRIRGLVLRLLSRRPSRECTDGTAATSIRPADFEKAWRVFLSKRTPDFQAWRDQRDWTARKCALRDAGKLLPANEWEPGKPGLYLNVRRDFNSQQLEETVIHVPPHHRCRKRCTEPIRIFCCGA